MHKAQNNRLLVVKHLDRVIDNANRHQQRIKRARCAQNIDPRHGADDVTDPERQHQQQQQKRLGVHAGIGDEIGWDIADQCTDHSGVKGNQKRLEQDVAVKPVAQNFDPVIQVKTNLICAGRRAQPKGINDNEQHWHNQQKTDRRQ